MIKQFLKKPYLLLIIFILAMPACRKNTCPANMKDGADKKNVKWKKTKKHQSGLWDKKMRRR